MKRMDDLPSLADVKRKEWLKKHKKEIKEYHHKYYQEHKDIIDKRTSEFKNKKYKEDPEFREYVKKTAKKWRAKPKNKQKMKEYHHKYYLEHKDTYNAKNKANSYKDEMIKKFKSLSRPKKRGV